MAKPVHTVQVRELVEFVLRRGNLGGEREFVGSNRALAGIRGHQKIQRSRPTGYRTELPVEFAVEAEEFTLQIRGRIDGLLVTAQTVLLEEIKTVQGSWNHEADSLHWGQAKCYGFIHAQAHALSELDLQLVYLELPTGEVTEFRQTFSFAELADFFNATIAMYVDWLRERHQWCHTRNASIAALAFPFPEYRAGQRELAVAAYRVLAKGGRLFLAAPTGIGKTISVVFPAVKALGEGKLERIFYLTARTVGRAIAEKALVDLRRAGLKLRAATLTAKEKVCVRAGQACDPLTCPLALGYYDRIKPAIREALAREEITRGVLETVGQQYQVCPFELSLDVSVWADAIICDYNYVFDPQVYLRRHFAEAGGAYGFLVDEAHNLVDRAREMFSADLDGREILEVKRALKMAVPRCAKALAKLHAAMRQVCSAAEPGRESFAASDPLTELNLFPAHPAAVEKRIPTSSHESKALADLGGEFVAPTGSLPYRRLAVGKPSRAQELAKLPPASSGFMESGDLQNWMHIETMHRILKRRRNTGLESPANPQAGKPAPRGRFMESHQEVRTDCELPEGLIASLETALAEAEIWLARNEPADFRDALLAIYFRMHSFRRTAELYDERFVTMVEPQPAVNVRLFCLDPSQLLHQALARGRAAIFFSATLTPMDYYRALLGGAPDDPALQLASPFPPENLGILVQDRIQTHFKGRTESLADVVAAIGGLVQGRRGNYLVYFPSYHYLNATLQAFQASHPSLAVLVQRPGMTEPEREAFLAAFSAEHGETLVGFAVLGGIFGEGIDLVGERLIGAVIVGVGLPQLCVERDLIRDYFEQHNAPGFEFAYTFPGMNRVLQAVGRVIRSETDRGLVLLIDARFGESRYRRLFPPWWRFVRVRHAAGLAEAVGRFWNSG